MLHHLGLPDERLLDVAGTDLDRSLAPDHLTTVWIPHVGEPVAAELVRFAELVRTLRERCPWDREQTHRTLTRHLLEETYEVLEAIEGLPASSAHLEEELGDLLFQVVFHATLAAEEGTFTLADVARGIHDKLVHRHPHVFGDVEAHTPDAVASNWERIKQAEKGRGSLMDGIPGKLPSLLYAFKVQRKAASVGVDVAGPPARGEVDDGVVGELLFDVVALARKAGVDPEAALRAAAGRFRDRFGAAERRAQDGHIDVAAAWAALDRRSR